MPLYKVSLLPGRPDQPAVPTDPKLASPASPAVVAKRAALYLRVSKSTANADGRPGQTEQNQRLQLRRFAEQNGYDLARPDGTLREFVDRESGRKGRRERSAFAAAFEAAERREYDTLLFWSLDRFSREGIRKTIAYLQQLESLGVHFRSYTEPYLSTDNELVSHVLLGVLSYFAEYEAQKISRRTVAGLERARAEGKSLGRPSTFARHRKDLEQMHGAGVAKAEMARRTGLSYNTVKQHLRRIDAERSASS